jgi:hypothetical protein
MPKSPEFQTYRGELSDKLQEIRQSDPENPKEARAEARGYLKAKQETGEYQEAAKIHKKMVDKKRADSLIKTEKFDEILEKKIKEVTIKDIFFILDNIDLSSSKDINKLSEFCKLCKTAGGTAIQGIDSLKILNKTHKTKMRYLGKILDSLDNKYILLKTFAKLENIFVLIEMSESPSDLNSRMINNGHILVKIGKQNISNVMGCQDVDDLLENMQDNNAYLFLATMFASADFVSQSLNTYDTGMFLYHIKRESSEGEVLDEYGVPLEYHWLSNLLKEHEEFFKLYNRVIMKYLSNVIHTPNGHIISGKSNKYSVEELSGLCKQVPDPYSVDKPDPDRLTQLVKEDSREKECNTKEIAEQVEKKSKKIIEKIKQFREILEEYDARMEFAKPKGN